MGPVMLSTVFMACRRPPLIFKLCASGKKTPVQDDQESLHKNYTLVEPRVKGPRMHPSSSAQSGQPVNEAQKPSTLEVRTEPGT